ncbi:hypothetical protein ACOJIV_20395 [Haloarcula sp. AONF1]
MALSTIPEPSIDELRDRADWSEGAWSAAEEHLSAERIAERQVGSYLWENWKADLQPKGYDWQKFQSDTAPAIPVIRRWATDQTDWSKLIERVESELEL